MLDFWSGAQVRVKGDRGALYRRWRSLGASQRVSSHHRRVHRPQYELPLGPHALLFGLDERGDTWFQAERHPLEPWFGHPLPDAEHLWDYVEYEVTGENIGPFGASRHTESKPIVVRFRGYSGYSKLAATFLGWPRESP
jgi:hypothetical protein